MHRPSTSTKTRLSECCFPINKSRDLDDVPQGGLEMAAYRRNDLRMIEEHGGLKHCVQSYECSIAHADTLIGELLRALDTSTHREKHHNRTVVRSWISLRREGSLRQEHTLGTLHACSVGLGRPRSHSSSLSMRPSRRPDLSVPNTIWPVRPPKTRRFGRCRHPTFASRSCDRMETSGNH